MERLIREPRADGNGDDSDMELHLDCPEARVETRNADRQTLYRPVVIQSDHGAGLCLARSISPKGVKAKTCMHVQVDERVFVYFSTDLAVPGWVAWSDGEMIGIEFDESIDVHDVLSLFTQRPRRGRTNRLPRLPIHCAAALTVNGRSAIIEVRDISQRGVQIAASFLQPGDQVELHVDGLERRQAVVQWIHTGIAGLSFVTPLAFDELAHWAAEQNAFELPAAS